tara:strand:- start:1012 stop:1233 length:222 start_codon:yes stop_codon:yes gene_type:complete
MVWQGEVTIKMKVDVRVETEEEVREALWNFCAADEDEVDFHLSEVNGLLEELVLHDRGEQGCEYETSGKVMEV